MTIFVSPHPFNYGCGFFCVLRQSDHRGTGCAGTRGKTGQIGPNESSTQVSVSVSLRTVESCFVQDRKVMEPGGIEPPIIGYYGHLSGVAHRWKRRWLASPIVFACRAMAPSVNKAS